MLRPNTSYHNLKSKKTDLITIQKNLNITYGKEKGRNIMKDDSAREIQLEVSPETYQRLQSRAIEKGDYDTTEEFIVYVLDQVGQKAQQESKTATELAIDQKVDRAKEIVKRALEYHQGKNIAIAWTGGKDSTLLLWLVKEVIEENPDLAMPKLFFIDEGDVFDEIWEFVDQLKDQWGLELMVVHNNDVSDKAGKLGGTVKVIDLNERNQKEVNRLDPSVKEFTYEPESFIGNHLMKTVAMNQYLEDNEIDVFFEGIRWDEQEARANETYFSPRAGSEFNREHMRVFPILHFDEKDVWEAIHKYQIPYCKLYKEGYRSLGARVTTTKTSDKPAWQQDLENTTEREGRRQDKENLMKRLRDLGYM